MTGPGRVQRGRGLREADGLPGVSLDVSGEGRRVIVGRVMLVAVLTDLLRRH